MPSHKLIAVLLLALACAGCRKNQTLGTLAVDIYLHPESGSSEDILLQTAIRENLVANAATERGVYARVLNLQVVLTGSVSTASARDEAAKVAQGTRVTVNDKTLAPKEVTNLVKVEP
ncbi:MAG TPA: BON domain-containing protein [Bryobacteraceae bacterium]|nr:BON domain-containing protein [Bryobacteraceae bacterium]